MASWNTLDLGCVIRRTAIVDGVEYVRFVGYIDGIDVPEWVNSPFEKVAVLTASDRLARLGSERAGPLYSMLDHETLNLSPVLYYPLNEAAEATQATPIGVASGTLRTDPMLIINNGGTLTLGGGVSLPTDTRGVAGFESKFHDDTGNLMAGADYFLATFQTPVTYSAAAPTSVSAWFRCDQRWTNSPTARVFELGPTNGVIYGVRINAAGNLVGTIGANTITGPPIADTGTLYHVVLKAESGQASKMYVNGVLYMGGTVASSTVDFYNFTVGGPWHGTISNVAVFRSALSAGNVAALYAAGLNGTNGMLADAAMTLVAGYAQVPAEEINCAPPAQTRVGHIQIAGRAATDVMREIAAVEGGALFVDTNGIIQFQTRPQRWAVGAADYTIPNGDIVDTLSLTYNDKYIVNDSNVGRVNGSRARAVNTASVQRYGTYSESVEYPFFTDAEAASRARFRVASYKDAAPRMGELSLRVLTSLDAESLMQLDLSSLIAIDGLSADAPAGFAKQWIEGITETQSINDYVLTFATSPILATQTQAASYFRVGSGTTSQVGASAMVAP